MVLFKGVKQPEGKASHSRPLVSRFRIHGALSPYAFVAQCLGTRQLYLYHTCYVKLRPWMFIMCCSFQCDGASYMFLCLCMQQVVGPRLFSRNVLHCLLDQTVVKVHSLICSIHIFQLRSLQFFVPH